MTGPLSQAVPMLPVRYQPGDFIAFPLPYGRTLLIEVGAVYVKTVSGDTIKLAVRSAER